MRKEKVTNVSKPGAAVRIKRALVEKQIDACVAELDNADAIREAVVAGITRFNVVRATPGAATVGFMCECIQEGFGWPN